MKIEWYAVNDWNMTEGPFNSRSEVRKSIEDNWRSGSQRCSLEDYMKDWTIFPQIDKKDF